MVLIGATLKGAHHHCLVHGSLCSLWVLEPIWGQRRGVMGAGDRLHRIGAVIYWSKSRYGGTSLRNTNTAVDRNPNT